MQNGLAATGLGVYLVAVAYQGNASALLAALEKERGFVKWGVASLLLYWAIEVPALRQFILPLVAVAVIANLAKSGQNGELTAIQKGLRDVWNIL